MLQAEVAQREGLPSTELAVYHAGTPLEDEMFLAQQLTDGATLEVSVRMLGGKVHGSLARAGKVKGQTPKVISRKLEQRCCSGSRVADRTLSDPFNIPWLFSMSHLLHARSILCIYMQTPKLFWIQWRWQPIQLLYVPHLSILKTFTQAVFSWIAWRNPVTVDFLLKEIWQGRSWTSASSLIYKKYGNADYLSGIVTYKKTVMFMCIVWDWSLRLWWRSKQDQSNLVLNVSRLLLSARNPGP